jgi:hypothetical protein
MKKANYNFCVVWLTKDYYPMLDGGQTLKILWL